MVSDTPTQQTEGIELKAMKPNNNDVAGSAQADSPTTISHDLNDVSDVVTDVEKGITPPPCSPAGPEQEQHPESAPGPEVCAARPVQKNSFLSRIKAANRKDKILTAVSVFAVLCVFVITGLAVVVGFDSMEIKSLSAQVHTTASGQQMVAAAAAAAAAAATTTITTNGVDMRDSGYMEGYSAFLDDSIYDGLVHDAVIPQSTPEACDDDMSTALVQPVLTAIVPVLTDFVNLTVTTTVTSTASNHSTSVLAVSTAPVTTSTASSAVDESSMLSSVSMTSTTASSTETCGEWGDGAGPCARPYGAPNTTPASALSSTPAVSGAMAMSPAPLTATLLTPISSVTSTTSVAFTSSFTDASSLDASAATVTVTVTEISTVHGGCNASSETIAGLGGTTFYGTSTLVSLRTSTLSGPNGGPLFTTTETALWGNTSFATPANFTLTLKSTLAPTTTNGFGFGAGAGATGTVPLASGGKQSLPKPMSMSMSDSTTGSGVYCTVMLTVLVAVLLF